MTMAQKTATSERSRGRPLDTKQQNLKMQILDSAEKLFADGGYAATSIRRIADEAGVNPALVHYYFRNKKTLLQSVMERALEPLSQAIAAMNKGPVASPQVIARLLLSMAAEHPNIPQLLTREVLLPGGEMLEYFSQHMAPRLGGALPALLRREKSAGRMRTDSEPAISALLIVAVCVFPFVARALAEPVLGINFDKRGIDALDQQITALLKRGLTS